MNSKLPRYDFVLFFDVKDGNPNGDPDAGNLPRTDPEDNRGLVTDVCLKRKVRNFVQLSRQEAKGFRIYVKEKAVLSTVQGEAYAELGLEAPVEGADDGGEAGDEKATKGAKGAKAKGKKPEADVVKQAQQKMCEMFFDVRAFGAVMSLKKNNAGQVKGPVQLTFARSIDPIVALEHSITRMAVATEEEAKEQGGDNRTMGRKNTVSYAMYRAHGFVSPSFAAKTGFSAEDAALLWQSLEHMFEDDRSASRGEMGACALVIFEHEAEWGSARAAELFARVTCERRDTSKPARQASDYAIKVDGAEIKGLRTLLRVKREGNGVVLSAAGG